ncbi:MAG: hypothetical protein MPJ50_12185 [Pirellulales bacterium]|nr:hypothetical protein [Pirellulales bacterium]
MKARSAACCLIVTVVLTSTAGCGISTQNDREMQRADPTYVTSAFDPGTVETFEGQIVGLERVNIDPREGKERPALIIRFIGNGEFPKVYLGPADFMNSQSLDTRIMAYAEVTASRVNFPGVEFIASEIKIGDKNVVLRDGLGTPYWREQGPSDQSEYGGIRIPRISNADDRSANLSS